MENPKELVVLLSEAEQKTFEAVNSIMHECGLPCFLMEPIVGNVYRQILDGKAKELAEAKAREALRTMKIDRRVTSDDHNKTDH